MGTLFLLAAMLSGIHLSDDPGRVPVLIDNIEFREDARAAIDSLYNRNGEAVHRTISPWKERWPEHPIWFLWEAMELWWEVLEDLHDRSMDEELLDRLERADRAAAELLAGNPDHPDGQIIRAVANGYIARHHANRNRWVRSVRTAQTARRAHEELGRLMPDLSDNLFAEGLKRYYSAYLPEAYLVLRPFRWLLPDGDREEGLRLLEQSSREGVFSRPEAAYFLGVILLNYEEDHERAVKQFRSLVDAYPMNGFYRRLLVRSLVRQGSFFHADEQIELALQHWERHELPGGSVLREELFYWRGKILLRSGRNDEAFEQLVRSWESGRDLPNLKERQLHALSAYHAGVAAERSGRNEEARIYYLYVTRMECEPEVRRRAESRLREI